MKQQINLYQPMFRKQKKVFSAMTMVQIFLFFGFVFAALYGYELYRLNPLKQQLPRVKNDLQLLTSQIEKLGKNRPFEAKTELLRKEISRVTNEIDQRKYIQKILATQAFGNDKGFSPYMEALARQHVQGAWLTRIVIEQGGKTVGLEGKSMASEFVPIYLQQLSNEEVMAGASFNTMELNRPDEGEETDYLAFKLSTN